MKKTSFSLLLIIFFSSFFFKAYASDVSENNKFGIHVTGSEDLARAADLVNSSGGDWGYVTVVISENDKNREKWQAFFDLCREKHLIPLVRIATYLEDEFWARPTLESIWLWAEFLDSLNWPTKTQHIIVFNEPNHAKEWGGKINPEEYVLVLDEALKVFKQKNENFFILNAGFDQAAPNSEETLSEIDFLRRMEARIPGIFSRLDGWSSHSYPNHGFVGKPWEEGKATIKGYQWELEILKNEFGLEKNLPVFITETGWPHGEGVNGEKFFNKEKVAKFIKQAFRKVWLPDEEVVAVTPFVLNYPFFPFENFSWLDQKGNPYPHFEEVRKIKKTKGKPVQIEKFEIEEFFLPPFLPANFFYTGEIVLKNTGQSIWGEKPFRVKNSSDLELSDLILPGGKKVKPGEKALFNFSLKCPERGGDYFLSWQGLPSYKLKVFEVWKLTNQENTLFNRVFNKFLNLWYSLKNRL